MLRIDFTSPTPILKQIMFYIINSTSLSLPFSLILKDGDSSAFEMTAKLKIITSNIAGG